MDARKWGCLAAVTGMTLALGTTSPALGAAGDGGGGGADTGSLYSDLVVALRAADGTPILEEYFVDSDDDGTPDTYEYCVQPVSYTRVPGVAMTVSPLDGRDIWVIPLQGEWLGSTDPLPVEEIEACDPQPQYAMFVTEAELERLNLTRTSESVIAKKTNDVRIKLSTADEITLDAAGRIATDGLSLDAAPEYAAMYESLMTTGTIPGLPASMAGPPAGIPAGSAGSFDAYELAAVAVGTAASKTVPITPDTVQYYNRIVGFATADPPPSWAGMYPFISSADPDPVTPMPSSGLPAAEKFVDYGSFTYNRSETYVGSVTWLDVAKLEWQVTPILDAVDFTNVTGEPIGTSTLTGLPAFAQMADDTRAVIGYLHEHEVVLPGFYMDPVGVDTTAQQLKAITDPAVDISNLPTQVFQTLPFQTTFSLFNPWGGTTVDGARVRVRVDAADAALAPADVSMSSGGQDVTLTSDAGDLVGWWGPDTGTVVDPGYQASTPFDVLVAGTAPSGAYTLTLELVDVDDPATVLATDSGTLQVHADALSVLWGGEVAPLATQGTYLPLSVRVYSPEASTDGADLTFSITGPDDDPTTPLVEELAAGDARVYGDDGTDMVAMPLTLDAAGALVGTWHTPLLDGYTDLTLYLSVAEGAPVGQYALDLGILGGTDLADAVYVSVAAPDEHGGDPGTGEDTTAPVVTISLDGLTDGTASFTIGVNEDTSSLQARMTSGGVAGDWTDVVAGAVSYSDLAPGEHVLSVKAADLAGNTATYALYFTVPEPEPEPVSATLTLSNDRSGDDVALVDGPPAVAGATIRLFAVRPDGTLVRPFLAERVANSSGNARFVVDDARTGVVRSYRGKVLPTATTLAAWTGIRKIR